MEHARALEAIRTVLEQAPSPVAVVVADASGEVVASLHMDGAARDTYENARRKAYTAARSDVPSSGALGDKVGSMPTELASFDPQFSFFRGGLGAFDGERRVGAIGVSGLPGPEDEALAATAIRAAGYAPPPGG